MLQLGSQIRVRGHDCNAFNEIFLHIRINLVFGLALINHSHGTPNRHVLVRELHSEPDLDDVAPRDRVDVESRIPFRRCVRQALQAVARGRIQQ